MKKSNIISFIVLACLIALPVNGLALPISGDGRLGSFTGSIDYSGGDEGAKLRISLTNTSPEKSGLYLAGFYFSNTAIAAAQMETSGNFELVQSSGSFDVRALYRPTSDTLINTTDVNTEQPMTFYFSLKGEKLAGLTAESFIKDFVVYFGANGTTVDKAPVSVSEPSTMLLLGFGLLVIGVGLRKKTQ